jgi:hypothetical protein
VKLYSNDNAELLTVSRIERRGAELIIKGKVFGTMPMTARLTPQEVRAALRLMGWKDLVFLCTMPFRGAVVPPGKPK